MTLEELLMQQQSPYNIPELPEPVNPLMHALARSSYTAAGEVGRQSRDLGAAKQRMFDFEVQKEQEKAAIANMFNMRQMQNQEANQRFNQEWLPFQLQEQFRRDDINHGRNVEAATVANTRTLERDKVNDKADLDRSVKIADKTADRQEDAQRNNMLRELLKQKNTPIDPKDYAAAQKMYADARSAGKTPWEAALIVEQAGYKVKSAYENGWLEKAFGGGTVDADSVILEKKQNPLFELLTRGGLDRGLTSPSLPSAVEQLMGLNSQAGVQGTPSVQSAPATQAAPAPKAAPQGMRRVRNTKTGQTGSIKAGAKLPAGVEYID